MEKKLETCESCKICQEDSDDKFINELDAETNSEEAARNSEEETAEQSMEGFMSLFETLTKGLSEVNKELPMIKLMKTHPNAVIPKYETLGAVGFDVATPFKFTLEPGQRFLVDTGLKFLDIPKGWELQVRSRSGLSAKNGIMVVNAPGTIDEDYRGQLGVILLNTGNEPKTFNVGDRIAQCVFSPVFRCQISEGTLEEETKTERGPDGFGSTDEVKKDA